MTKSGITRKIDELGRIVVPKEMRYNLGIRDGEPLEIYTEDNSIIIKKYSQVGNIKDISENLCNIISDICNVLVIVSDREKIIACNNGIKSLIGYSLKDIHKRLIDNRDTYIGSSLEEMFNLKKHFIIVPLITSQDSSGLVIIASDDKNDVYLKYAKILQRILVQKLDIAS